MEKTKAIGHREKKQQAGAPLQPDANGVRLNLSHRARSHGQRPYPQSSGKWLKRVSNLTCIFKVFPKMSGKRGWRVQRAELGGWLHRAEPVGIRTERWRNRRHKECSQQDSAARCVSM